ncbi:hypothetical protein [Limnohabitans sp. T6-5]|uniref:hypothetical protein n=1 Tax=Limnohabitans sp. T6-5 TaxID=1100724 RepID=UPI001E2B6DF7|nr:hypothetical protein [Limnohabitans sp. T6-5]
MNTSEALAEGNIIHDPRDLHTGADRPKSVDIQASAVSWGAILAGAAVTAIMSLILLILGTGLGLSAVSPWSEKGISAISFGVSTIGWLALTQVIASALGGYIAGRLRTRWVSVHPNEVYFRDTAHGFLSWTIASLATASLLTSFAGSIAGTATQVGTTVVNGASMAGVALGNTEPSKFDADNNRTDYFLDALFRSQPSTGSTNSPRNAAGDNTGGAMSGNAQQRSEVSHIFMNSLRSGPLPPADASYTAQLIAQRTGLSQQEAEQRVNDVYSRMQARLKAAQTSARDAADKARKASTYATLWLFVSMLAGAFMASWTAIYGGRQRDR